MLPRIILRALFFPDAGGKAIAWGNQHLKERWQQLSKHICSLSKALMRLVNIPTITFFWICSQPWWGFTSSLLVQTEVELGACRGTCVCKPWYIAPVEMDTAHKHHCWLLLSHSFLLPVSPKTSFKRRSLSVLLKGACLRTCQPSTIYPPTGDARSTVSYLAEQIIEAFTHITERMRWCEQDFQLNNRPLSSTLQPPSQEALWDVDSGHQETLGESSCRGFTPSWLQQLHSPDKKVQFLPWWLWISTCLAGSAAFLRTPFPLEMNLPLLKAALGEKCWFHTWQRTNKWRNPSILSTSTSCPAQGELHTHIQHHHKPQQAPATRTFTRKYSPALHTIDLFRDFLI